MQGNIFAHKPYLHGMLGIVKILNHLPPRLKVGLGTRQLKTFANSLGELFLFKHQGYFIK